MNYNNKGPLELFASAARTADPTAVGVINHHWRGLLIVVDVTALAATPSVQPTIYVKDNNGDYNEIIYQGTAFTATGEHSYLVYPGAVAADFDGTDCAGIPVPQDIQIGMVHGDADSITYSANLYWIL